MRKAIQTEPALTRSEAERRFLELIRAAHLPEPEVNVRVGRWEVDFLWRDLRLIVEFDGYAFSLIAQFVRARPTARRGAQRTEPPRPTSHLAPDHRRARGARRDPRPRYGSTLSSAIWVPVCSNSISKMPVIDALKETVAILFAGISFVMS